MKKITVLAAFLLAALAVNAQEKVTKTNVLGKWIIFSVEVPGQVYYNIEKDSLVLGDAVKSSVDASQLPMMTTMLKGQFASFSKMSFTFKPDGTAEFTTPTGDKETGTYIVDEANSTITSAKKEEKNGNVLSKVMVLENGQKMDMTSNQPTGDIHIVVKKVQ